MIYSDQLGMDQNWGTKGPTALVIILSILTCTHVSTLKVVVQLS